MLNPNYFHYLWNGRTNEEYKLRGTHYIFHPASSLVMSAACFNSEQELDNALVRVKKIQAEVAFDAAFGGATAHKMNKWVVVALMVPNPAVEWPNNWEHIAKEAAQWHADNCEFHARQNSNLLPY